MVDLSALPIIDLRDIGPDEGFPVSFANLQDELKENECSTIERAYWL